VAGCEVRLAHQVPAPELELERKVTCLKSQCWTSVAGPNTHEKLVVRQRVIDKSGASSSSMERNPKLDFALESTSPVPDRLEPNEWSLLKAPRGGLCGIWPFKM